MVAEAEGRPLEDFVAEDEGNGAKHGGLWRYGCCKCAKRARLEVRPKQYVVGCGKCPRCVYSLLGPRRTEEEQVEWEKRRRRWHMLQLDEDGGM